MIVRCIWHKPTPVYLGEKPPFEDKRVSDGVCRECMMRLFKEAGMKTESRGGEAGDLENKLDS